MSAVAQAEQRQDPAARPRKTVALLACGAVYGISYILVNDLVAAFLIPGYSRVDQAISELSAIGSPARGFLISTFLPFAALTIAFGVGVMRTARARAQRTLGVALIIYGATSFVWLFFPMTARSDMVAGAAMPSNDIGHIVMSMFTVALIMTAFVSGAIALGGWFRVYSILTAVAAMIFGLLTSAMSAKIATGEGTPFMGLYERVNVFGWALWLTVLSVILIRRERSEPRPDRSMG